MKRVFGVVSLAYVGILLVLNGKANLPGHYTGSPINYSFEARIFIGTIIILSLCRALVSEYLLRTKIEIRMHLIFSWIMWSIAALSLVGFQLMQVRESQPEQMLLLTLLAIPLFLIIPKKSFTYLCLHQITIS